MLGLTSAVVVLWWPAVVSSCGGLLVERNGVIRTPDFPAPLQVPIRCQWLIDSSGLAEPEVQIVVYFTQLFVTSGLTFTEYAFYDPEDPSLQRSPNLLLSITEENSVTTRWLSTRSRFLVIELELERLEGNHLRVLDHLLDVFGFNITYQMAAEPVINDSCSVIDCSFAGNCYIGANHKEFWCSCFEGFSGRSCNFGPICTPAGGVCLNGGVCRHAGKYPTCTCLEGYTGSRCEATLTDPRCDDEDCLIRCRTSGHEGSPCRCGGGQAVEGDRWRFIITLSLDNITELSVQHPGKTLNNYLEKQIQKLFRGFSLSSFEGVKILNVSDSGEVSFHFFGDLLDLSKVRQGQQKISERRRMGDVLLAKSPVLLRHEPGLRLEDIQVNNWEVFENEQVILSCMAQGSEQMEFNWYKDDHPIDPFKGLGVLWMHILPKNSREEYTAILGIDAAKAVDGGRYTCQVTDWGIQECKSIYLEVQVAPDILVSPMAASVKKGENIDLTCVSTNQKVSYSWTKDKNLFPLNPASEVWEDLKPWGSILRVKNIQKSVTYTCQAQAKGVARERSVHIDLLAPGSCKETEEFGIVWRSTSPGSLAVAECPQRYIGYSTRYCMPVNPGKASWVEPDFSKCVSEFLDQIITQFQVISRGTLRTSLWTLLSELHSWLSSRSPPYLGEGEPVVDLLSSFTAFVNLTFTSEEVLNVTKMFYANVDLLLSKPNFFVHLEKVGKLQSLVDLWSLLWADHLNTTAANLIYSEIAIDVQKLSNQISHQYYVPMLNSYPRWYAADIGINVVSQPNQVSSVVSVVSYLNISKFLPRLSSQVLSDGSELLYKIESNIISISSQGCTKIHLDMKLPLKNEDKYNWNITCARADEISSRWDFTSCQIPGIPRNAGNSSHCVCTGTGLYTALLTRISSDKMHEVARELSSPIVVLGCGCCLFLSCLTVLLLSCSRTFLQLLKVQFCLAVCAIMAVFVHVMWVVPAEDMYFFISILLELLFFLALSSHLGKLLIIYNEVVFLRNTKNTKFTVLGLTTGVTLLPCLISGTTESFSATKFRTCWWLPIGTASFYIATASTLCIIILFAVLSIRLLNRLHYLKAVKKPKSSHVIYCRLSLIKKTSALFSITVLVAISSVFFVNMPNSISIYIFSSLSAFLGFLMMVCYILHSESPLNLRLIKQLKIAAKDEEYSSGSDYNLFKFFTKQESEVENKDIPHTIRESGTEMKEMPNSFFNKPKLVTIENHCVFQKKEQNVDLEVYPTSPRKRGQSAVDNIDSSADVSRVGDNGKNQGKAKLGQITGVEEVMLLEDSSQGAVSPSEVISGI